MNASTADFTGLIMDGGTIPDRRRDPVDTIESARHPPLRRSQLGRSVAERSLPGTQRPSGPLPAMTPYGLAVETLAIAAAPFAPTAGATPTQTLPSHPTCPIG